MKELSLHILDIVQNSVVAKATLIEIRITESVYKDMLSIKISDNGHGMDQNTLKVVTDPFFTTRTTRKVGLGLSLFKQAAGQCGGRMEVKSVPDMGTSVEVTMQLGHIDRQPLGDMAGVMALLVSSYPEIEFYYLHHTDDGQYEFDTREIKQELGDVPVTNPKVEKFLQEMIRENLTEIKVQ